MEDIKLLRRNLRACLQEATSSFRWFKLARSGLQINVYIAYESRGGGVLFVGGKFLLGMCRCSLRAPTPL